MQLTHKSIFTYNKYNDIEKNIDTLFYHYDCDDIKIDAKILQSPIKYENDKKVEDEYYSYLYDSDGNLIRMDEKSGPQYKEFYPTGVRKKIYYGFGSYSEFDEDGYLRKAIMAVRKGDVYTFEYSKMDAYDNWTQMITYEDGVPYLITERQITYYE